VEEIEKIRRDIRRIRAYIRSLPDRDQLADVDTLLSVAESETRRVSERLPPKGDV
jgi:hypothetical protein